MQNVEIKNDNRIVPASIMKPVGEGPFPAVVMNHGHGGSKEEHGGFTGIAEALLKKGILTIRMDFPGCGDSVEPFTENYLSNMISDSNACLKYIMDNYNIDKDRLGILGYSMGGRIALTIVSDKESPYKALGLLAPSADPGEELLVSILGGEEEYEKLFKEVSSKDEAETFLNPFKEDQILSKKWFDEIIKSHPLKNIREFKGEILLICGENDEVVPKDVTKKVSKAYRDTKEVTIKDSDHGFGFKSNEVSITDKVEDFFAEFFEETLK